MGLHIFNSFLGLVMAFAKFRKSLRKAHKIIFFGTCLCLIIFLIQNYQLTGGNSFVEYFVLVYFLALLPLSGHWDVLIHAFAATIGLTLLPLLILFT